MKNWKSILLTPAPAALSTHVYGLIDEMRDKFGDHYGIDCGDEPVKAFHLRGLTDAQKAHLYSEDLYIPDEGISDDQEELYATQRLQNLLYDWVVQNLPRLMDRKYAIAVDDELIAETEKDIHETLGDYLALGIIKNHPKPKIEEVHIMLEKFWEQTMQPYTEPDHSLPSRP